MSEENQELVGKFCLYQRIHENGLHPAIPYFSFNRAYSVIFLDMHHAYRNDEPKIGIDIGVRADQLTPVDTTTRRGREILSGLLLEIATGLEGTNTASRKIMLKPKLNAHSNK